MSKNSSARATRKSRTLDLIARALAAYLQSELKGGHTLRPHYSQYNSPLGRSKHLELARNGILPAERVGGRVLIRQDVVHLWLSHQSLTSLT